MSELNLNAESRPERAKGALRSLRDNGYLPAVFYDTKGNNVAIKVKYVPFTKVWKQAGTTELVELNVDGKKRPALIWAVDSDPVKPFYIHADFYGVDMKKELTISVPVVVTGEPKGVADNDGVLEVYRESIEVSCLPDNIPNEISIDVSELDINDNINIEDLTLPEGVTPIFDENENFAIVGVSHYVEEAIEPEIEEEEAEIIGEEGPAGEDEAEDQEESED
ncbi:MAG: 50S ribosomal protein L25 [Desulfonatronovibrionaceae bacterium]